MKKIMYEMGITYSEYLLGTYTENAIESLVLSHKESPPQNELERGERDAALDALRRIDALSIEGRYEKERAALNQKIMQNPEIVKSIQAMRKLQSHFSKPSVNILVEHTQNFLAGLRSPDQEQKKRFRRLADHLSLGDKTPGEIAPVLEILERAKGRKGRPSLPTPWTNEITHMDAMRLLVAGGMSIPQAAREQSKGEGRADAAERAKTLEKLYRKRIQIRE